MTSGKVAVSTPIVFNRAERVIERKRIDGRSLARLERSGILVRWTAIV